MSSTPELQIYHYNRTSFLVQSRTRTHVVNGVVQPEFHKVEFFESDEQYPEICACEDFQMGIPRMIKEGKIPDTREHRRCFHIRYLRAKLADAMVEHLVAGDPSQPVFEPK